MKRSRLFRTESFRYAALYTVLFACSMAALIAIVFLILDQSFKANLLREIDDDLGSIRAAYAAARPGRAEHEAKEMIDDRLLAPDADDVFLLQHSRQRLAGNLPVMPPRLGVFSMRLSAGAGRTESSSLILGHGMMLSASDYAFVGRDLRRVNETEKGVLYAFGLVLAVSLLLASLSGLLLGRSFLTRVDAITQTCFAIMAGNLGQRIPVAGRGSEFERLGLAINSMLDRILALMESLRQVSTDIAHDLRTPLAHMRQKLERARNDAVSSQDYAMAVDGAVTECDKLLAIFAALLRIAQIEAGARRAEFRDLDLCLLVQKARDIYSPVMDDTGHLFHADICPSPMLRGDEQLLLQLISNLLDNAIAHTPPGTKVELTCTARGATAVLAVSDRGPGIPQEDRAKVLRRFYRREQSRTTAGSGLGLALVAATADLHGATLKLDDNAPGLRVTVAFPPPK